MTRHLLLAPLLLASCERDPDATPPVDSPPVDTALVDTAPDETTPPIETEDTAEPVLVPVVAAEGVFDVHALKMGDLDAGKELDILPPGDFLWQPTSETTRQLTPYNGAKLYVAGLEPVGWDACSVAEVSADPIDASDPAYADLPVGTWLCASTTEDLVSALQITAIDPADAHRLTVSFTTWELVELGTTTTPDEP